MHNIYDVPRIAASDTSKPYIEGIQATISGIFRTVATAVIYHRENRQGDSIHVSFAHRVAESLTQMLQKFEPTHYNPSVLDTIKTIKNCGHIEQKRKEHIRNETKEIEKRLKETFSGIELYTGAEKEDVIALFNITKDITVNAQRLFLHFLNAEFKSAKAEGEVIELRFKQFEAIVDKMAPITKGLLGFGPPTHMNTLQ